MYQSSKVNIESKISRYKLNQSLKIGVQGSKRLKLKNVYMHTDAIFLSASRCQCMPRTAWLPPAQGRDGRAVTGL